LKRSLKELAAAKYLDWAEILPQFNGGTLRRLQDTRAFHRKQSEKVSEQTRPPQGASLRWDRLFLVELFLIEEYNQLASKIQGLFSDPQRGDKDLKTFSDAAADLFAGNWVFLGHITRKKVNSFFYPRAVATLERLPEEVDHIAVTVGKVLPSLFAVSFSVTLTEFATAKLKNLFDRHYSPQFSFGGVLPTRSNLSRSNSRPPNHVMRETILEYMSTVRARIEVALAPHIKGIFLQAATAVAPQMPAVEILSLRGFVAENVEKSMEQLKTHSAWTDSFGLTQWRRDLQFADSNVLFHLPDYTFDDLKETTPYRFIVFRHEGDDREAEERTDRVIGNLSEQLTPLIGVAGLIDTARRKLEPLRVAVYKTLAGKMSFMGLRREIALNNKMQLHQMILRRLEFEMSDSRWNMQSAAQQLRDFRSRDERIGNSLGECLLYGIDERIKTVSGHGEVASKLISEYLERRNLRVAYWLQWQLLLWTVLIAVVTIYSLVKDSASFRHFVGWLHHLLYL
jgi:hypothetical protein